MRQKPILFLLLSLITVAGISQRPGSQLLSAKKSSEGTHPKNVSLAITCPNGVFVQTDASCQATVITPTPTSTCNITFMSYSIGGGPVRVITPVGNVYPATINLGVYASGTFDVVWFVIDDCAASATCTQTIFVQDQIAPEIGCPLNVTVNNSSNPSPSAFTQVVIDLPKVSDNCTGPAEIVYTNNYNQGPDASGNYPVGTTIVCWTASDLAGNSASCCMNVTVLDDTKPSIACPDTITVDCEAPTPFDYFLYFQQAGGSASDETAIDTSSFAWVRDSITNGNCPIEKTVLRYYTISDSTGNADTCFQVIFVQDTLPPVALCRDITVYLDQEGSATASLDSLNDNSYDACSDTLEILANHSLQFTCAELPQAISVSLTFTDECGNTSYCQAQISVADTLIPAITCPQNITIMPDLGVCTATGVNLGIPQYDDNCTVARVIATLDQAEVFDQTIFPAGINSVIWIATDQSGNTGTCAQLVTVVDNEPPVISCPQNITVNADPNACEAIVQYSDPTGQDNCSEVTIDMNRGFVSGSAFPVGTTEVRYIGTDENLNADTCSFYVTVIDIMDPVITCPANITISAIPGQCGRVVTYVVPEGTDNCPGVESELFSGQPTGTFFPVGTTSITYLATAANGMTASCTFTVRINDTQLPSIACPANITVNSNTGQCGSIVTFTPPVGVDNCPNAVTSLVSGIPSGSFYNAGITTNVYRVTDASGNSVACQFTVTVTDNVPPQITCPANMTVSSQTGQCGANVSFTSPVGTDNCPGAATLQTSGLVSGAFFTVGTTTNQFRVTAGNGATASCSFTVLVQDVQAPTISCPPSVTVNSQNNQCAATVTYAAPTANDNCPGFTTALISGLQSNSSFNVGTTAITYRVTAANQATSTCTFTVTVVDNQPPAVACPANRDITLSDNCSVQVPDLTALVTRTDNCGPTTISQLPAPGAILSSGQGVQHTLTMTVTDQNSRTSTCTVVLTAQDLTGPKLTCAPPDTILISEITSLPVTALYSSVTDNCGGSVTVQVRRSGTVCGGTAQDIFGPTAQFCCEDVAKNISFILRATDQRGNSATCTTTIRVEDDSEPVIIQGLPDITISCQFPLDPKHLEAFGTLVDDPAKRKPIIINDVFYPNGIAGMDGYFSDNCSGTLVSYSVNNQLTSCRTGFLIRTFIVRDRGGNTDTITQRIEVINQDLFSLEDITWPAYSVEYNQCNDDDPDTSVTGAPVLRTSFCDLVAATYKDQTFLHPTSCKYVKRTWTVIDWCQYKTNTPNTPGKWTFIQHIYVTNNVAPVISNKACRDTVVCIQDNSCLAKVALQAQGTDDCLPVNIRWSYTVDVNNDGGLPEISGTGDRITGDFQQGNYKVVWTAKDGCSNQSQCSFVFTVRDCKKPVAIAKQGLAISLSAFTGTAVVHATDFNNLSSDNCTASSLLKYSFSKNTSHTSITMNCDSVGRRKIYFWVTDLAGNQSMVETFITVQDNHHFCGNTTGGRLTISGHVFTEEKIMFPETGITIRGIETEGECNTDAQGKYEFANLPNDRSYQITPDKKTDMLKGITTLDLVMIQRHVLGISPLNSAYKMIAADVNGSGTITASDIVELRKLLLGVQSQFTKNDPWRFVDANHAFGQSENIWQYPAFSALEPSAENLRTADFIIVKTGDVNGTISQAANNSLESRNQTSVTITVPDMLLVADRTMTIPVYSSDLDGYLGIQGSIHLRQDAKVTGFLPGSVAMQESNTHIVNDAQGSRILFSYHDEEGISASQDKPLFYIVVQSTENVHITDVFSTDNTLASLAIDHQAQERKMEFRILESPTFMVVSQNFPNPFSDETSFKVTVQKEMNARVDLFDQAGKEISSFYYMLHAGENRITLSRETLGDTEGMIFCRIVAGNESRSVKMLRIK